jgi:hypothetical protein
MVGDMQVLAAGDMCAICQEKMHAPISLRCKHVFCEDCVSEWYAIWLVSFNPFFHVRTWSTLHLYSSVPPPASSLVLFQGVEG